MNCFCVCYSIGFFPPDKPNLGQTNGCWSLYKRWKEVAKTKIKSTEQNHQTNLDLNTYYKQETNKQHTLSPHFYLFIKF